MLAELDGFDPSVGVILLAATNRPEVLDPALLRAGRFDRQVLVDRPDRKGRIEILRVHTKHVTLGNGVVLDDIAAITTGFTGADLANLVNEAAIIATRRGASGISLTDFTAAMERVVAGLEKKSRVLSAEERRRVAFHEMGRALVAATLQGVDAVLKVSIIPRGVGALGYTIQRPTQDKFLITETDLRNRIAVLMGGRAAEALVFQGISPPGRQMICNARHRLPWICQLAKGMAVPLGQRTYLPPPASFLAPFDIDRPNASELTAREIDVAARDVIAAAFDRATEILKSRRSDLEGGAALLLQKETITADEFTPLRKPEQLRAA